jgi:phage-related protein (TIGR01555 family)
MINWLKSLLGKKPAAAQVAPEKKRGMVINAVALAEMVAQSKALSVQKESEVIEPYKPPAGVIPAAQVQAAMAMDATPYDYINTVYCGAKFKGYQRLAILSQQPEYRKISETIAKEMTRKWGEVISTGDDDKTDRIELIKAALDKHHIQDLFRKAAEMDGFFGRGQIYIDVKGPNGQTARETPDELKTPLILDKAKIAQGALVGFRAVEPVWTYPGQYNADDPLAPDYYRPSVWFVMGKTVHASRLLSFVSREVPDLLKASYNFGGLSMTQLAEPYVENWLRTRDSVSDMLHSFSTSGIKTNLSAILAGENDSSMTARAQLFTTVRDNQNVFMLDQDTEEFFQFNVPLSGLDALQAQSQEQMASVASIPLVKLLGITPSGLNASADGEIRVFYDDIQAMQERLFARPLKTVMDVIQLDLFGDIDPEIGFEFAPLYQLDEVQRATVRKTDADTDAVLIGAGVISPDDSRERIMADPDTGYVALEGGAEDMPGLTDDDDDEDGPDVPDRA